MTYAKLEARKVTDGRERRREPFERDPLIGRFFHSFSAHGEIQWQGYIEAKINDGHYLVQLFDWMLGDPSTERVVSLDMMREWKLYRTNGEMVDAYQNEHGRSRVGNNAGNKPENDTGPNVAASDPVSETIRDSD